MTLYASGSHILGASGAVYSTGGSGGTFVPVGSQTMTGTIADGQPVVLNSTSLGTQPYSQEPLLWAPMDTQLAPSAAGRVTSWSSPSSGLTYSSGGGPTGLGCATGSGSPGPGGTGTTSQWTLGFDVRSSPAWSGNPYAINNFGQTMYVYRQVQRILLPYLPFSGGYNTKNFRAWAASAGIGTGGVPPDIYAPIDDGRFSVDGPTPDWSPSPDYNADPIALAAYENLTGWFTEEIQIVSNSAVGNTDANYNWWAIAPGLTFAISNITNASSCVVTSSSTQSTNPFEQLGNNEQQLTFGGCTGMTQINGLIGHVTAAGGSAGAWTATVGINTSGFGTYTGGGVCTWVAWNFPNVSYQTNSWKFLQTSTMGLTNAVAGEGNMLIMYPCHYIVDGSSGRTNAPLGSYPNYGMTFVNDSLLRVVIQDSPIYIAATIREIQIHSSWSGTQIGMTLRKGGKFISGQNGYVFTTDANGVPTLQGHVVWP
jgi:hypothetical protein